MDPHALLPERADVRQGECRRLEASSAVGTQWSMRSTLTRRLAAATVRARMEARKRDLLGRPAQAGDLRRELKRSYDRSSWNRFGVASSCWRHDCMEAGRLLAETR